MKLILTVFFTLITLTGWGSQPNLDDPKTLKNIIKEARPSEETYSGNVLSKNFAKLPYSGWVKNTYFNGRICQLYYLNLKSNREGLEVSWYENGGKWRETRYKDGKKHGLEIAWDDRGQVDTECHYEDGEKHGLYIKWHSSGNKEEEGHYQYGKKHGLWTRWSENGQKIQETHYQNDMQHGRETDWKNGEKWREAYYENGKQHGLSNYWENGEKWLETRYEGGVKQGLEIVWGDAGKKWRETYYEGGRPHGRETSWYPGGQKKDEGSYRDGQKEGLWQEWDQIGKLIEANYDSGIREPNLGEWKLKVESEQIRSTEPSKVFLGNYGKRQAIYSIQWMKEGVFEGRIFLPESGRRLGFFGKNDVEGQLGCEVWEANSLQGTGKMSKMTRGDVFVWSGVINDIARTQLSFGKTSNGRTSKAFKASYVGRDYGSEIYVDLEWKKDGKVSGSYSKSKPKLRYILEGEWIADGLLYLDSFNPQSYLLHRILLWKKDMGNGGTAWEGYSFDPMTDQVSKFAFSEKTPDASGKAVERMAFIDGESNFRNGPSTKTQVLYQPANGSSGTVIRREGNWIQIRLDNGDVGWAYKSNLKPVP